MKGRLKGTRKVIGLILCLIINRLMDASFILHFFFLFFIIGSHDGLYYAVTQQILRCLTEIALRRRFVDTVRLMASPDAKNRKGVVGLSLLYFLFNVMTLMKFITVKGEY